MQVSKYSKGSSNLGWLFDSLIYSAIRVFDKNTYCKWNGPRDLKDQPLQTREQKLQDSVEPTFLYQLLLLAFPSRADFPVQDTRA